MPAYPKTPLEDKLAWMRERQRQKEEASLQAQASAQAKAAMEQTARQQESNGTLIGALGGSRRRMRRVSEVAEFLGVSATTVLRWFRDRAVVVRGPRKTTMLISEQVLDEWIAEHTAQPKQRARR